mgnify:CR=1 FL=1
MISFEKTQQDVAEVKKEEPKKEEPAPKEIVAEIKIQDERLKEQGLILIEPRT